jgi:hypothetical protein
MNSLAKFTLEMKLWKVFIVNFSILFVVALFTILSIDLIAVGIQNIELGKELFISSIVAFAFSGLITLYISLARASVKFWEYSKVVEELIEKENSNLEEMERIFNVEFKKLKSMSMGEPHSREVLKLYTILNTKYKMVKDAQQKM